VGKMTVKTNANGLKFIKCSRSELRKLNASDFTEGDVIRVSKYFIFIKYGGYDTPALRTTVENIQTGIRVDCTPGCGTPYYIDDFKNR